jgi:hypothetical protein
MSRQCQGNRNSALLRPLTLLTSMAAPWGRMAHTVVRAPNGLLTWSLQICLDHLDEFARRLRLSSRRLLRRVEHVSGKVVFHQFTHKADESAAN